MAAVSVIFRGRVDRCFDWGWHCGHGFRGRVDRCFDCGAGGFGRVRRRVGRDRRRDYGDGGPGLRRPADGAGPVGRVRRGSQHGPGCGFRGHGGREDRRFRFEGFDVGRHDGG